MCSCNKTQVSPYDPTKLSIHSVLRQEDDFWPEFQKKLFLSMRLCTSMMRRTSQPMMISIVVLISTLKRLQKSQTSTENGITMPDPVINPCAFPVTIGITVFFDEQHNSKVFLNPYSLWDMVSAALMSLNHTNDRYCMSNQYPQPTTHQPRTDSYPVFSSLRRLDSQRKGLRVSFAFFQRNYLPDGRVNELVATVEELSDLWKPGVKDGIPPFVMNSNCI